MSALPSPLRPHPARLRRTALSGQGVRFAAIGGLSTVAYLVLYSVLRREVDAQGANLVALLVTAVANTAANRRLTFGVRGRDGAARHQGQGLVVFAIGLALTSGSLALLHRSAARPARTTELAVLIGANVAATVVRFALLKLWVFRPASGAGSVGAGTAGAEGEAKAA